MTLLVASPAFFRSSPIPFLFISLTLFSSKSHSMVGPPKFPRECDADYILSRKAQEMFTDRAFLLIMPVSEFGIIQRHINCTPIHELLTTKPEEVNGDVKDALYNVMNNKDDKSVALPLNMQPFIQRVYSYFTLRKTEANLSRSMYTPPKTRWSHAGSKGRYPKKNNKHMHSLNTLGMH